jgi:hypothetical protein
MDGCKLDMEFVNGWKYNMCLADVKRYDFNYQMNQLNDNIECILILIIHSLKES